MIDRRWLLIGTGVVTLIVGWVAWDGLPPNPVGPWLDRAGNPVPHERLEVWTGTDHCDTTSTKFMALEWPLDVTALSEPTRMEHYVWEPPDDLIPTEFVTPGVVENMPADAENTGFHRGRLTLWVSESNIRRAVFVMAGDEIQRWAFVPGAGSCA